MRWQTLTRRPASRQGRRRDGAGRGSCGRAGAGGRGGRYRLRGGGFLFQAGDYLEADTVLSRAAADPAAGPLRAKAGMLRCLARGRACRCGPAGASSDAYTAALEAAASRLSQADPSTDEARWLLGQLAVAAGDRARAETLWSAIAAGSPRWLDSRLAIAALDRDELDRQQINPDRHKLMELFTRADRFLDACDRPGADPRRPMAELLARPGPAQPHARRRHARDRPRTLRTRQPARRHARRFSIGPGSIAWSPWSRWGGTSKPNARRRAIPRGAIPPSTTALFDAVRLLDQCAATAETDLRQRRFGLVLKLIVEPLVMSTEEKLDADHHSELAMRLTRALLFTGADREARRSVAAWRGGPQSTDERAPPRPGRHLQPARGLLARHRRAAPAVQEQSLGIAPLARRPLCAGPGLFPYRPAQGGRPAHRLDGDPPPRARRQLPSTTSSSTSASGSA